MKTVVTFAYDLGRGGIDEMADLCTRSFRAHMPDADLVLTLRGEIEQDGGWGRKVRNRRYGDMNIAVFRRLHEMWSDGADLLVVDADTLCVRDAPWPPGDSMRMFNRTCAKVPYRQFRRHDYYNAGVKYLPSTMMLETWHVGQSLVRAWDHEMWAYDQYVWNVMLRAERERIDLDARYNWIEGRQYDNLGVPRSDAYIVHYLQSRGAKKVLKRMRRDAEHFL